MLSSWECSHLKMILSKLDINFCVGEERVYKGNHCKGKEYSKANTNIPKVYINPHDKPINQKQKIAARTRVNVTTCLYISPDNRAISLSTLIALHVRTDTPHKTKLETSIILAM